MSLRYELQTVRAGQVADCSVEHSRTRPWRLHYRDEEIGHVMCKASDLFESLRQLRLLLEMHGKRILCNGARVDAWASNLARDMGGGRKVYITRKGALATMADLVPTFGSSSAETIATVREQMNYHRDWLESVVDQISILPRDVASEARLRSGGRVYKIEGDFGADEFVPNGAIVGAWQVDSDGIVIGEFVPDPSYRGRSGT